MFTVNSSAIHQHAFLIMGFRDTAANHELIAAVDDAEDYQFFLDNVWGQGEAELFAALIPVSEMLGAIAEMLKTATPLECAAPRGLFEYNVSQVVGGFLAAHVINHGGSLPDPLMASGMVINVVLSYFDDLPPHRRPVLTAVQDEWRITFPTTMH